MKKNFIPVGYIRVLLLKQFYQLRWQRTRCDRQFFNNLVYKSFVSPTVKEWLLKSV